MGFSRQEYWSGLPFPGGLPNPGIKSESPALQTDALPSEPPGSLSDNKGQLDNFKWIRLKLDQFSSVQFIHSVMSDSLWRHGLLHARLLCPSPTPGACSNSCQVGDAIPPSHPLSSPSPPAFNLSQHQGLFQWVSSAVFPNTTVQKHQFFGAQLSL